MTEITLITQEDTTRHQMLAQASLGEHVIVFEGCYYYLPEQVDMTHLIETERIFNCPYKGPCHWIDLQGGDGKRHKEVAWVYHDPQPGYESLKDRIGFYPGIRSVIGTKVEMQR